MDAVSILNATLTSSQNLSSDALAGGEHVLFHALARASESGVLADILVLVAFMALLCSQCFWRPRLTSAILVSWVAWFAFRLSQGQAAWTQIAMHAQHARKATEMAASALLEMLKSWCVLLAPALVDLQHMLEPAATGLRRGSLHVWTQMSWNERGLSALLLLAVVSSVATVSALMRHKETVTEVLFQLSFIICGPAVWWLTSRVPHEYSFHLVGLFMSLLPSLASLWLFLQSQWEKDTLHKKAKSETAPDTWFAAFDSVESPAEEPVSAELQSKIHLWLSYWACWPFFYVAFACINAAEFIAKDDKSAVDGLFITMILWAQLWRASRIAPYVFALCAKLLHSCTEKTRRAADEASNEAMSKGMMCYKTISERVTDSWMIYLGAAIVVLLATAVLLRVVELAEAFVTLLFLFGVAFDSARCVARHVADVYKSRLAFWIVATAWLKLRETPVLGGTLVVWTPLVLVIALAAGETLLSSIVFIAASCLSRCRGHSQEVVEVNVKESKYQEVPKSERLEEARSFK